MMYRAPSHYRDVRYDEKGNVRSVEIVDTSSKKTLRIDMLEKKAYWLHSPTNVYGPVSPTSSFAGLVERVPKPAIGQRHLNGTTVDVYRYAGKQSMDLWIDPESGRLVGTSNPGGDQFDPNADIPEDGPTLTSGRIQSEIVYGTSVDDELFELKVPEGFETVEAPDRPSEEDLIEWLRVTARFGGGVFHATQRGFEMQELQAARRDANRKDELEALSKLIGKHMLNRNLPLVQSFIKGSVAEGSFRYVGGGIKLGSASEIVCWYKLKETGQLRAIYGDLSVKDVQERDLPPDQE
ncbi:MAG: hypothetical protein MI861_18390 [Pirellulales bacterium]|nr:hypothetical protein [Pirellulales bacterium]